MFLLESSFMDGLLDQAVPIILTVVGTGLSWLFGMAMRKGWIDKDFHDAALLAAQRAKDKYLAEIAKAKNPDGDGGVTVTDEEKSKARAEALGHFKEFAKGPVLKFAMRKGDTFIKSKIGYYLDRLLAKEKEEAAPAAGS